MDITINGKRLKTKERTHAYLKRRLSFPDYYGNNLDALADMLGDANERITFILKNLDALGEFGARLSRVLRDASDEKDNIRIKEKP